MQLSLSQIEALWIQNGGPTQEAPTAAAIAYAESSGNPSNVNPTDNGGKQTSWGLFQISDGTHNPFTNWWDPIANTKAAVQKYIGYGNNFSAWGTYNSGAYKQYLPQAVAAMGGSMATPAPSGTPSPSATPGSNSWLDQLFSPLSNLENASAGSGGPFASISYLQNLTSPANLKYLLIGFGIFAIGMAVVLSNHTEVIETVAKAASAGE